MGNAGVVPYQPWDRDGYASVTPLPPEVGPTDVVPVEHRPQGNITIEQKVYPVGLVIIPSGAELQGTTPSTLPLEMTSDQRISVKIGSPNAPNGVVVLFTSKK